MPELTGTDVSAYTNGRMDADDDATTRALAAALGLARRYCGWHVTPVIDEDVVLDGRGGRILQLPTLALAALHDVVEDDTALDVAELYTSAIGRVSKANGGCWSQRFGGIAVSMSHGFDEAPAWESAVLSYIDRTALSIGAGQRETVGPFSFAESPTTAGSAFTPEEKMLLDLYRLEPRT